MKKLIAVLEIVGLLFGILGIGFIGGIAKPIYNKLPWIYISKSEEKIESIKPTQSYSYIKSILNESQVSESFEFPLKNEGTEIGSRKIWANDLYTMIGYFRNDESLYGYIMICQDEKFQPKIGSDFYNKNGFGKLMETNFVDAQNESLCYIDTVDALYTSNVLCSSYYLELYDFNRSDFSYGLAFTNLGVNIDEQYDENFWKVNTLPFFKMGVTTEVQNPVTNTVYKEYRNMKPNTMLLFNNRSDIDSTKFINQIMENGLGISYSDLRRLY